MIASSMLTVCGGVAHGLAPLSHSEFQAAQHALSRIGSTTGDLGSSLGGIAKSATLIGGSVSANALRTPGLLPGSGGDTFFGGARSSVFANIGRDTIVGGSTRPIAASLDIASGHNVSNFALSTDTINVAGTTALNVRAIDPTENVRGHTITVGDKTTITINGLSAHEISKLSH